LTSGVKAALILANTVLKTSRNDAEEKQNTMQVLSFTPSSFRPYEDSNAISNPTETMEEDAEMSIESIMTLRNQLELRKEALTLRMNLNL
jgi:hypothetical protein